MDRKITFAIAVAVLLGTSALASAQTGEEFPPYVQGSGYPFGYQPYGYYYGYPTYGYYGSAPGYYGYTSRYYAPSFGVWIGGY